MPIQYDQIPVAQAPASQTPVQQVTPPSQPQQPAPPPPHPVKKFLFAEIILGEVVMGIIAVCLVFGLLNYFNIISLDKAFPGLSFLPKQAKTTKTQTFSYDDSLAYDNLSKFDNEILKPAYMTSQQKSTQELSNIFTQSWNTTDQKVFVNQQFQFQPNTNKDQFYKLVINSLDESLSTASPSPKQASTITARYLAVTINDADWDCITTSQTRCTYKVTENGFLKDIRVFWIPGANLINVIACKISQDTPTLLQSCIPAK